MADDKAKALEAKNRGNASFQAGKHEEAIAAFTEAIQFDPENHILFSNRSAAYASLEQFSKALEDANHCVKLSPQWPKGYSRKGAAFFGLGQFEEALEAYSEGLKIDPNNEQLKQGLQSVHMKLQAQQAAMFHELGKAFSDPNTLTKLALDPRTRDFATQPDFIQKIQQIQQQPEMLGIIMQQDQRVMMAVLALLGVGSGPMEGETASAEQRPAPPEVKEETPKEEPIEELTEEEKADRQRKNEAKQFKEKGSEAYRTRHLEEALECFTKAMELDDKDITFLLNRAAVYLEMCATDECINDCKKAIDIGRAHYADFKLIARAFGRMGKAYARQGKIDDAISNYKASLTEHRTAEILKELNDTESKKKKMEEEAYLNPELAEEERRKGNVAFSEGRNPDAVKHYNEGIRRDPKNHILYSNRAAALMKLGDYQEAIKDCEHCLKINPFFVKAITRKAHCHFYLKEFHKALEWYEKGMKIEENNAELEDGLRRTLMAISSTGEEPDQERLQRAMADPEIQAILQDPVIQQVLKDLKENPREAQVALQNPGVQSKLSKLMAAGIIRTK